MHKSYYNSAEITCVQFEVDRFYTFKVRMPKQKKSFFGNPV